MTLYHCDYFKRNYCKHNLHTELSFHPSPSPSEPLWYLYSLLFHSWNCFCSHPPTHLVGSYAIHGCSHNISHEKPAMLRAYTSGYWDACIVQLVRVWAFFPSGFLSSHDLQRFTYLHGVEVIPPMLMIRNEVASIVWSFLHMWPEYGKGRSHEWTWY
jgi:hypothetical protein